MDKNRVEKLGELVGNLLAATIYFCGTAVLVALTIKLIMWMFGI